MGDADTPDLGPLVRACHEVAGQGLVRCSSGNLSWRLSGDRVAITASGAWLGRVTESQVAVCRLSDGACLNGRRPSVESALHLGVLRARPDVNVVLHCQSPYATAIGCGDVEGLDFNVIIEVPLYVGRPGFVPYLTPGTRELAEAVGDAVARHDLVVMKNHGQAIGGADFDDVIQKACFFELACQVLLCGRGVGRLTEGAVRNLAAYRASRRPGGG